jgi:hypothetical protein
MDRLFPRLSNKNNKTAILLNDFKDTISHNEDEPSDDDNQYSTIIPREMLIPRFKKRTLNPIKIKDIYLSKKREQLYREKDVKRRYDEHRSLTKEKVQTLDHSTLPHVIKNMSFFKINERVKFNIRFLSLKK